MTNIEWLRSLSADKLLDFLRPSCNLCIHCGNCSEDYDCIESKVAWLNAEHKEELKPCPCCGGKAVLADTGVYCNDCGMGTTFGVKEIEDAIKTWNRRVVENGHE